MAAAEGISPSRLDPSARGRRAGFWGASASAEAFLDQLVTWRELGQVHAHHAGDAAARYATLPAWARETLAAHAADPRPARYGLATLEAARTGDEVWNAAQRQLLAEGTIHNHLRMLWGKKVLEWTRRPDEALRILLALNDRWALDGRDPSSVSGIAWCFGRYDHPWPPRPVFGAVRAMSSAAARRKLDLGPYLARWGEAAGEGAAP